jgi:RNA polymerase sigma-70 factor (ECF subfamily)
MLRAHSVSLRFRSVHPFVSPLHTELAPSQQLGHSATAEARPSVEWRWLARLRGKTEPARAPRAALVDAAVIEACQRGDADAFRELFEAYKGRVYSIALYFTGDRSAAHDVSQQVFSTVYTAIARFRHEAAFDTWLYRIVVNACRHEHRRSRRFVSLEDHVAPHSQRVEGSVEHDLLRQERIDAVREGIATLAPKLRLPLVLRHLEGLSYEEIATVLGCSSGTVASRLNRARARLATQLAHLQHKA